MPTLVPSSDSRYPTGGAPRLGVWRLRVLRVAAPFLTIAIVASLGSPVTVQAAGSPYAAAVRLDSPAAFWRLGERTGTVAADALGRNPGRYRAAPGLGKTAVIANDADSAVGFSGAGDVRIASSLALRPARTLSLEAWIKPSSLPAAGYVRTILGKANSWGLRLIGSRLAFDMVQGGVLRRLLSPTRMVVTGGKFHVVGTYDGVRQRLYVNGRLVASRAQTGIPGRTTNDVTIGSRSGLTQRFRGTIDEVAVYGYRLSAVRVAAHFAAGRAVTTPTTTPVAPSAVRTGMAAHFMWQSLAETTADLDLMRAAGMKFVRFDFSWRNSETTKGTYNYFDKLDSVLDAVQAHGMTFAITVLETPAWANGGQGMFAPPTNPADYARFIGALAHHTSARPGMVWEIWNEPNDSHFWTTGPSSAGYTAMLRSAYTAVKANDPDATVLGGSIVFNDTAFLKGMYANGAAGSFDGLAIHPYTGARAPGDTSNAFFSFKSSVPQFIAVMAANGQASKPIWITEMGWSTGDVSDATRAIYLRDAVTLVRLWPTVRGMAAYTLHQTQFAAYGLLTTSNATTASWRAYAAAQ